jgi:Family of unknown function (DUF5996)
MKAPAEPCTANSEQGASMSEHADWPELCYEEWAPTKKTLHMVSQMIGKAKLALVPPQPEWLHARLELDGHGFTTGPLPYGSRVATIGIDVFTSTLWIRVSNGRGADVPLGPTRCVADIWGGFQAALAGLDLELDIWEKPQEVADVTPFSQDTHDCTLVPEHAQRFHPILSSTNAVFEEFRAQFFGRSGVQFWWGSFDLAVLLFSGRKISAPSDRGYIMHYDLDAEHFNAGFWAGDDNASQPGFYAYVFPRPVGCEMARIEPHCAGWVEEMGEWLIPYEAVRTCADPRQAILDFLGAAYRVATTLGGWDAVAHEYVRPPASRRG